MKIFSENLSSFFTIEVLGVEMMYPSLHLSVEVNDEGFCGFNEIYVETDTLKKFVSDLQTCEQTRRGMAHLVSISPDELELTIESFDGWGHFALTYKIGKYFYYSGIAGTRLVSGGFNLDSSLFRQVVSDFGKLFPILLTY